MNPSKPPSLSVIIPVYNEALCLEELCERLYPVLKMIGGKFEVLFVDDGSTDGTMDLLLKLKQKHKPMKIVRFARNFGQHAAATAGMAECAGNVIITMDADLQNPPEEIPKLVVALQRGYDIAAGWRRQRVDSVLRTFPSFLVNRLISMLTRVNLHDYGCMLRAYKRGLIEQYLKCAESNSYITAVMSLLTRNIIEVEVRHEPRTKGKSKYHFFSLFSFVINILVGFSNVPLRIMNWAGILFSAGGAGLGICLLANRSYYGNNELMTRIILTVLLFLFGIQFLFLGFLGRYLSGIYTETRNRPRYVIDKIFD